ncbi:MAG: autotransporter-associated beta strand repeat-containing protein [Verrucomicrobiaceae bacterium]
MKKMLFRAAVTLPFLVGGLLGAEPDPAGVLIKPIPDKLIVLTFDDAPASHATVVAPILKQMGFGGTMYVCDFDSFRTRKDWYLTWRQMQEMAKDGFEIGNHTKGHGGSLPAFMAMEDELLAHGCPKPSTVCWPLYNADSSIIPQLQAGGYSFGRGGYERPYHPTLDNPFDVPSFTIKDGVTVEAFIKQAQQACNGKVVVYCFHGVPDMEHGGVSLEPTTFKVMMQYLKDNNYQCIAMQDMAKYIDPVKAARLPHTKSKIDGPANDATVKNDKPFVAAAAKEIQGFDISGAQVQRTPDGFIVFAPYAMDITALAPKIAVSPGATIEPASGVARDFSKPQTYTVKGLDGSTRSYMIVVRKHAVATAKDVLGFEVPGATAAAISGNTIGVYVPASMDVNALAPVLKLSPLATSVPASGTVVDFTKPKTYTATAQDGTTRLFTVTVARSDKPNCFTWSGGESGNWSDTTKWTGPAGITSAPTNGGGANCILNFNKAGKSELSNDFKESFRLNQLNLSLGQGMGLKLKSNGLVFAADPATGLLPGIRVNALFEPSEISGPIILSSDLTVNLNQGAEVMLTGLISGPGALVLNGTDFKPDWDDRDMWYGYRPCTLRIDNKVNTYAGGTVVSGGRLFLFTASQGLGTGPVKIMNRASIRVDGAEVINPLDATDSIIEGGTWNSDIVLHGTIRLSGSMHFNDKSGGISGPGGLMLVGGRGPFGWSNDGTTTLAGTNTYVGPTVVLRGTLHAKKAAALYNGDVRQWTPDKICVATSAALKISIGGPGEFTGAQVGTLLGNLTASVANNGLSAGAFVCLDTANAAAPVVVASVIADSKGSGGGAIVVEKLGAGTLQFSGANTYTGRTILEAGTLSVDSLNSVAGGKPSSSLGAPTVLENGIVDLGGDCGLTYTGKGEVTDRILDLVGEKQTVSLDQSGTGLLKFTSAPVYSGYGHSKTIILKGDAAGAGELAGDITDPYDRKQVATTSITKSGHGSWTLSGNNSFTGIAAISEGTLVLANGNSLGPKAEMRLSAGATIDLQFKGQMSIRQLSLDGKVQPAGIYNAASAPGTIKGPGTIKVQP